MSDALQIATAYLYQALDQPIGICLSSSDVNASIGRLQTAQAKSLDPDMTKIRVMKSRFFPDSEIWLVRRRIEAKVTTSLDDLQLAPPVEAK